MEFSKDFKQMVLGQAKHSAKTFSLSTGVNSFVIAFDDICKMDCEKSCYCGFCSSMQKLVGGDEQCHKIHAYACNQAVRFGGKYIYFCPLGFVHFVSPLISEGDLIGAVVGGPILLIEHEEFFFEEIIAKHNVPNTYLSILSKELKSVPFVPPEKVSSLSEMLYIIAAFINKDSQLEESEHILIQQSDISEKIHKIKEQNTEVEYYPIQKERELLNKITMGDKVGSSELLNDILGHIFFSSGGNFEIIKARVLELLVLLSRGAMEGGADTEVIFGMNCQYLNEINNFKTIERLTLWLSQIVARFTECVFDFKDFKHADVIKRAIEYIKRNYMKKITLEDVAEYTFLSPSYFSKIFSEEMDYNFNSFLNIIRIENAKMLLLNDNVPLVQVSELCGFEDQSYFTKVFKKIIGITPRKYKESRGRNTISK